MSQLKSGKEVFTLNNDIGTLQDQTPQWLFNAYCTVNNKQLVQKMFEICHVYGWNLSYESLTEEKDPAFYKELICHQYSNLPSQQDTTPKDLVDESRVDNSNLQDGSDLPIQDVITCMIVGAAAQGNVVIGPDGGLQSNAAAESFDKPDSNAIDVATDDAKRELDLVHGKNHQNKMPSTGHSRHKRVGNKLYASKNFWKHYDEDDSDAMEES
ncbi:uncharacterized protein ARMOST_03181 [Armillaria ostoyae]|uniref:Uncharacterized protein n=1 Tax=Armillaria ostoyae TaxID=47428 RepID=A0A284QTR9_ARMOS|nr:uncharacterized protein ARMOST_03181 [Armillaria ostoyae]